MFPTLISAIGKAANFVFNNADKLLSVIGSSISSFLGWKRASSVNSVLTVVEAVVSVVPQIVPAVKMVAYAIVFVAGIIWNLVQTIRDNKRWEEECAYAIATSRSYSKE